MMNDIEKVWVNVKRLATSSDWYESVESEGYIETIEKLVEKEKVITPAVNNGIYYCYNCGRGCGFEDDEIPNYCMFCGQRLK